MHTLKMKKIRDPVRAMKTSHVLLRIRFFYSPLICNENWAQVIKGTYMIMFVSVCVSVLTTLSESTMHSTFKTTPYLAFLIMIWIYTLDIQNLYNRYLSRIMVNDFDEVTDRPTQGPTNRRTDQYSHRVTS